MNLDSLIILVLALLFFGGIGYLAWSERNKKKIKMANPASSDAEIGAQAEQVEPRKRLAR
jgi:Flp pilus assembly protein CpaB